MKYPSLLATIMDCKSIEENISTKISSEDLAFMRLIRVMRLRHTMSRKNK